MSTSLTIHQVTDVNVTESEANGTKWTTYTFYTEDSDPVEVTMFPAHEEPTLTDANYD